MSNPLAFRRSKHRDHPTGIGLAAVDLHRPLLRPRHDQSDSPAGPRHAERLDNGWTPAPG